MGFIFCFYKKNVLINFNELISIVKKIIPIFSAIVANKGKCLFVGSQSLYFQTIFKASSRTISELFYLNIGALTNFYGVGFEAFFKFKNEKNRVLFFSLKFWNIIY